jgi:hypothetical protein
MSAMNHSGRLAPMIATPAPAGTPSLTNPRAARSTSRRYSFQVMGRQSPPTLYFKAGRSP